MERPSLWPNGRDLLIVVAVSLTILGVTTIIVSAFVDPAPQPVARVTTADLRAMADIARAIQHDPDSSPADVRTAERLGEVVDAVENGEVEIVPDTSAPAEGSTTPPAPATTTTSTTTTTTTTPRPPVTAPPWPGEHDAPLVTVP